jgi:phosphohistidine phosphatase
MKLYLVQHGEACKKEADPKRPLSERGKEDIEQLAGFLKQAGIRVDRVIHSGKLRAMQTAEQLSKAIAPGVEPEVNGRIHPNDDPKMFNLWSDGGDKDTLVVGHQPFMAKLVAHLIVEDEARLITAYLPGSIVCLEPMDDTRWQINWMIRPELFH